jgi:hypothetical protein
LTLTETGTWKYLRDIEPGGRIEEKGIESLNILMNNLIELT